MTATLLKSCFLAARPKTLPAAVVPVWAGTVLAWHSLGHIDEKLALATLLGALAIQIATNFFNDAIDARKGADTAKRLGPIRVTASGMMSRNSVMVAGSLFLMVAVLCGIVLYQARGWPIIAIGVPSLFLAYGYTGGPFPLAYRGMGECFVILFFGWVAVAGTVFIQTAAWSGDAMLLGTQVGLFSAVLISINNLRDREEDRLTGKHTLAVRLGPKAAKAGIVLEILLAGIVGLGWVGWGHPTWALAGLVSIVPGMIILHGIMTQRPGPGFNRLLALGGLQLIIFAAIFHAAVVRSH